VLLKDYQGAVNFGIKWLFLNFLLNLLRLPVAVAAVRVEQTSVVAVAVQGVFGVEL
jgi:hypothetical protein